jgi:hypothetical protein
MKKLFLVVALFCGSAQAADYKSAQRLDDGDVISADVFNDILDRIELTLKAITPAEMVGTWNVTWRTCVNGGPGNCSDLNVGTGWGSAVDNLYRERDDEWVISADGDGTYSVSMQKCFSGASNGAYYNDPCVARLAVDSGILLLGTESGAGVSLSSQHSEMYNIKRISQSRFTVWRLNSGSNSFVSFTLDEKNTYPEAPTALTASLDSGTVTLTWTENDTDFTSYSIRTKDKVDADFSELSTSSSNSYIDELEAGTTRWYRVFATNSNGDSVGSNVIRVGDPVVGSSDSSDDSSTTTTDDG